MVADAQGNQTKLLKQYYRKDDADVEEITSTLPNGLTTHNVLRTKLREDGTKLIQEERLDQFGLKSLVKTKVGVKGEQVIEEFNVLLHSDVPQKVRSRHIPAEQPDNIGTYRTYSEKATQTPKPTTTVQFCSKCKRKLSILTQPQKQAPHIPQSDEEESSTPELQPRHLKQQYS